MRAQGDRDATNPKGQELPTSPLLHPKQPTRDHDDHHDAQGPRAPAPGQPLLACPAGTSLPCPLFLHGRGGNKTARGDGSRVIVEDAAGGGRDGYVGERDGEKEGIGIRGGVEEERGGCTRRGRAYVLRRDGGRMRKDLRWRNGIPLFLWIDPLCINS